jgi:hypothetical protein
MGWRGLWLWAILLIFYRPSLADSLERLGVIASLLTQLENVTSLLGQLERECRACSPAPLPEDRQLRESLKDIGIENGSLPLTGKTLRVGVVVGECLPVFS